MYTYDLHVAGRGTVFGFQSDAKIFAMDVARFLPIDIIEWLQKALPSKGLEKARQSARCTIGIAKELVETKADELDVGKGKRDAFSLLSEC